MPSWMEDPDVMPTKDDALAVLGLPSLDQFDQEIKNRKDSINELESEIKSLKEIKESLVAETHEIFKEAERVVVQRTAETKKLMNEAVEVDKDIHDKMAAQTKREEDFIKEYNEFLIKRASLENEHNDRMNQLSAMNSALKVREDNILKSKESLDEHATDVFKSSIAIDEQKKALDNEKIQLDQLRNDVMQRERELKSAKEALKIKEDQINADHSDAMQRVTESYKVLAKAQEKEDNVMLLRKDLSVREDALREDKLNNTRVQINNEERLEFLHSEENRIDAKRQSLLELQEKIEKQLAKKETK